MAFNIYFPNPGQVAMVVDDGIDTYGDAQNENLLPTYIHLRIYHAGDPAPDPLPPEPPNDPKVHVIENPPGFWSVSGLKTADCNDGPDLPDNTLVGWAIFEAKPTQIQSVTFKGRCS